jgi:hypothetical protein
LKRSGVIWSGFDRRTKSVEGIDGGGRSKFGGGRVTDIFVSKSLARDSAMLGKLNLARSDRIGVKDSDSSEQLANMMDG